jgi:hypothetical protein
LAGENDLAQAEIDMYADIVTDLLNEIIRVRKADQDIKAELTAKLYAGKFQIRLYLFK